MESHEYLGYTYDQIEQVAKFLQQAVPNFTPKVGIICGSGLGPLADSLQDKVEVPYEDIPLFPTSTVAGHEGKLVFGKVGDVPVVCMKGRFHAYEGYPLWKVAMPVRVMRLLGAESLIVTNAGEGINDSFNVGDMMIIKDHVNMMGMGGQNPLRGPNMEEFGPRFTPMNKVYDREFIKAGRKIAENLGMGDITREGVYACVGGPNYETIAELKMLQICGVDSVGMSTAHEVIVAAHCGMKVFAFSLISNKAILDYDSQEVPNHDEVVAAAKANEEKLKTFTENMVKYIGGQMSLDCGAAGEGAAAPKAEEGTQAAAPMQFIPGICPAAVIQPCPCVSNAQLAQPQAPCAEETPTEEAPGDEAGPAGEAPDEAPTKRVSIQEPGEAEMTDEAGEVGGEAPEVATEETAEATAEESAEGEPIGEAPEAPSEEPDEVKEEEPEAPPEVEPTSEADVAPELAAVTDEPTEVAVDEAGEAPPESEPDKDAAVGPDASEEPQNADQQSQTVEDRGEQTDTPVEEIEEPIQEIGLQIEETTTEDGVAIQTLPETAEAKVGVEESFVIEPVTEEPTEPVEASTETPAEVPSEAPEAAEVSAAPEEEATAEPKEATEAPSEAEEAGPSVEVEGAEEKVEPSSEVAESGGEAPEPVKEVAPIPAVECSAAVRVECRSYAKCILREANVGPDTPIEPAVPPVEEKKEDPVEQKPTKKQEPCIAPCKKFMVRKKGDRCPTTCPPSRK